jgi:hypothetical protein
MDQSEITDVSGTPSVAVHSSPVHPADRKGKSRRESRRTYCRVHAGRETRTRMRGYTRATATEAGVGAREVLDAVARRYEARENGSARAVGAVARVYDRCAYLEFTGHGRTHLGPSMVLLGGRAFDGPLAAQIEPSADSSPVGGHGFSFEDVPVASGDRCRLRTGASTGRRVDELVLSVGDSFDVSLDRDLCRPVEANIAQYHEAGSIASGSDVWDRARELLRWLDERGIEDGLGWRPHLSRAVEGESCDDDLRALAGGWVSLLTGEETDRPASEWLTVLGRGPGATPSGDDIVSGILLTLYRTTDDRRRERLRRAGERVVARAEGRTTDVSTALLAQAARGRTSGRVEAGLRALLAPAASRSQCTDAFADVIRMGHTSGADTVLGALLAVLLVCPAVSP